jgi:recombination protein RecR
VKVIPQSLENLIEALSVLPGVGSRTAERYAFYLLKADPSKSQSLAEALNKVHAGVSYCPKTFALIDSSEEVSPLYSDPGRDKKTVMVVENPLDILAIEKTSQYNGTYHVLGGALSPIDGVGPEQLKIKELIKRVDEDAVEEIIIATNASVEGESTALLLQKEMSDIDIKITRLARGLPAGVDLEYADQITLTRALEGRQVF